jgi:DNA-directed RNA polymerase subunit RPC12/RpoP
MRSMVTMSRLKKLARRIEALPKPPCPGCGGKILIYERLPDGSLNFPYGDPCPECWDKPSSPGTPPGPVRRIEVVRLTDEGVEEE